MLQARILQAEAQQIVHAVQGPTCRQKCSRRGNGQGSSSRSDAAVEVLQAGVLLARVLQVRAAQGQVANARSAAYPNGCRPRRGITFKTALGTVPIRDAVNNRSRALLAAARRTARVNAAPSLAGSKPLCQLNMKRTSTDHASPYQWKGWAQTLMVQVPVCSVKGGGTNLFSWLLRC